MLSARANIQNIAGPNVAELSCDDVRIEFHQFHVKIPQFLTILRILKQHEMFQNVSIPNNIRSFCFNRFIFDYWDTFKKILEKIQRRNIRAPEYQGLVNDLRNGETRQINELFEYNGSYDTFVIHYFFLFFIDGQRGGRTCHYMAHNSKIGLYGCFQYIPLSILKKQVDLSIGNRRVIRPALPQRNTSTPNPGGGGPPHQASADAGPPFLDNESFNFDDSLFEL